MSKWVYSQQLAPSPVGEIQTHVNEAAPSHRRMYKQINLSLYLTVSQCVCVCVCVCV